MPDPIDLTLVYSELLAGEPHRRYEAAILLGTPSISGLTPQLEMAEHLLPLLEDDDDHVRYYAATSLGNLGFAIALEPLRRRLDREHDVGDSTLDVVAAIQQAIERLQRK